MNAVQAAWEQDLKQHRLAQCGGDLAAFQAHALQHLQLRTVVRVRPFQLQQCFPPLGGNLRRLSPFIRSETCSVVSWSTLFTGKPSPAHLPAGVQPGDGCARARLPWHRARRGTLLAGREQGGGRELPGC
jgi:hypothetical protein